MFPAMLLQHIILVFFSGYCRDPHPEFSEWTCPRYSNCPDRSTLVWDRPMLQGGLINLPKCCSRTFGQMRDGSRRKPEHAPQQNKASCTSNTFFSLALHYMDNFLNWGSVVWQARNQRHVDKESKFRKQSTGKGNGDSHNGCLNLGLLVP